MFYDVESGLRRKGRTDLDKMLKKAEIEIILTKNISRFGRDTVEILEALNQLKILGVL